MPSMLQAAIDYHDEGLCVIPIVPRDKKPAQLPEWGDQTWERFHTQRPDRNEVIQWYSNGHNYNVGIVHGPVSGNYITIDIDHNHGIFEAMKHKFPHLFTGRIEQSGSQEGYHIPLFLDELPSFGIDHRRERPRGNRTWKTKMGDVNCRVRYCQTVAPPSIHPTGNPYIFLQSAPITHLPNLNDLINWLNKLSPPPVKTAGPQVYNRPVQPSPHTNLIEAVKAAWPAALDVFKQFGIVRELQTESDGQIRVLGNGGLLIAAGDPQVWYCFADEIGGGVIEAWGWCRFGSAYDRKRHLRQVLIEMAQAAGIDVAQFYRRGDERHQQKLLHGNRSYWTTQFPVWGEMRVG